MESKPCAADCDRTYIRQGYDDASVLRIFFGLFFVYSPAVFLPVLLLSGAMVHIHLRLMGARNIRTLRSFLPARGSHRYPTLASQITKKETPRLAFWARTRLYWIINCTWYCPVSVAVLEWNAYLVKMVENWWCPFNHEKKSNYDVAAIDRSYWHNQLDIGQLHPDDRDNPTWNKDAADKV